VTGLYDDQGVLRFAGRDSDDCLAYAELFGLDRSGYSLESLALINLAGRCAVRPESSN